MNHLHFYTITINLMPADKITHVEIRMYRMGTGDCFALKFYKDKDVSFRMMIDCGTCSGSAKHLSKYIEDLKTYIGPELDLLVITHEHKDHVYGFDVCEDLWMEGIEIKKIWMGWSENDADRKVREWKREYGEKKKALALVSEKLSAAVQSKEFKAQFSEEALGARVIEARQNFSTVLDHFADLHLGAKAGEYKGMLRGMEVVKKQLADDNIEYFKPGDVIKNVEGLDGVKFFVLGPPLLHSEVKKEKGKKGEAYDHNKVLASSDAFAAAIVNESGHESDLAPFDAEYQHPAAGSRYADKKSEWRRIDFDWLYSGGALALRMNSLTNNLSLALAIEIGDDKKVMLFPGDAEFGSWSSWQDIKWDNKVSGGKEKFTEDLLNRTVFYKVAHHLSHNGTAKSVGLDMMTNDDLVAMATLDYEVIGSGWTSTMPNRALLKELLEKTKGRFLVMNEEGLYYDINNTRKLSTKIKEARSKMSQKEQQNFKKAVKQTELFIQYTLSV